MGETRSGMSVGDGVSVGNVRVAVAGIEAGVGVDVAVSVGAGPVGV